MLPPLYDTSDVTASPNRMGVSGRVSELQSRPQIWWRGRGSGLAFRPVLPRFAAFTVPFGQTVAGSSMTPLIARATRRPAPWATGCPAIVIGGESAGGPSWLQTAAKIPIGPDAPDWCTEYAVLE